MSSVRTSKPRIVLFNPKPKLNTPYFGLPLPLLAISSIPHERGYPISIVVEDVDSDFEERVLSACEGALLFGVTSLTGTMIINGLEMCAKVRERFPNLPIVWGGTHPSIAPEQTCEHPLVDIVVSGQGEETFMALIEALETNQPLDEVEGILFKRDGKVVKNPPRPTIDIDKLPPMPFDLVDMERHIVLHSKSLETRLGGERATTYYSSYGCPFSCSFCSEPMTSNRRWFAKSPERVVAELKTLQDTYGIELVIFEDPIFFVDVRRVRKICELMLEQNVKLRWAATSRLEAIKKIDDETWDVIKRAGFHQVFIGVESASPTVLKAIGKRYTRQDILDVAKILHERDVVLTCGFIQGIPVKSPDRSLDDISREDMRLTSETVLQIYQINPSAVVHLYLYTPYPGSVAYDLALDFGMIPPTTLEGWKDFQHENKLVPWILKEQQAFTQSWTIAQKAMRGHVRDRKRLQRKKVKGSLLYAYSVITRARYRNGYFKFPIEQQLMGKIAKRVMARRDPDQQNSGMLI